MSYIVIVSCMQLYSYTTHHIVRMYVRAVYGVRGVRIRIRVIRHMYREHEAVRFTALHQAVVAQHQEEAKQQAQQRRSLKAKKQALDRKVRQAQAAARAVQQVLDALTG